MDWLKLLIDYGIIGLLGAMSVIAVGIAIERRRFYKDIDLTRFTDKRELEFELTRKLHVIATIGSNAPYIGLLGTVLGIMFTFNALGKEGLMNSCMIMVGLALTLKVTAVGLVVAIPSVTMYNFLLRRVKELTMRWETGHGREKL